MRIVCPTDFSANSIQAIHFLIDLLKEMGGGDIDLLSAYHPSKTAAMLINMDKILEKQTRQDFELLRIQHLKDLPDNIQITEYQQKGNAVDLTLTLAKTTKPDLILLGTKGMTSMKSIFVGSNTRALIKRSSLPLMIIPPNVIYKKFKHIVLAVRGEEIEDIGIFQVLSALLNHSGAKLHLVHVDEGNSKFPFDPVLKNLFSKYDHDMITIEEGEVLEQLNKYCQETNIDLLCLIHKRRGPMEHIFGSSLSVKQLYMLEIPHLILMN